MQKRKIIAFVGVAAVLSALFGAPISGLIEAARLAVSQVPVCARANENFCFEEE